MDEYEAATERLRVAWATYHTADFESGPGDYHYEHCDFSELDRILAVRDRALSEKVWDKAIGAVYPHGYAPNPYRITEENN